MPQLQLLKTMIQSLRARLWQWWDSGEGTPVTYEYARERAARGAAFLDEVDPQWYARLDLQTLHLKSGTACVLGQLHGDFRLGLGRASLFNMSSAPRASRSPVRLGFLCVQGVPAAEAEQDYLYLDQAWTEEVQQRQADISPFEKELVLQGHEEVHLAN